ncbi:MAG: UxaA family hydrolase [Syntrophales bacterium]|nr:UxaA family hydrolase [Syntrophales bacterium]
MKQKAIVLSPRDNVATALTALRAGDSLELQIGGEDRLVVLVDDIAFGHKLCISEIENESPVVKYGEVIGVSTVTIHPGEHVHTHNVVSARGRGDLARGTE